MSLASSRAIFCSMVSNRSGFSSSMADTKESFAEGNSGREEGVGGREGAESVEAKSEALNRTMAPFRDRTRSSAGSFSNVRATAGRP